MTPPDVTVDQHGPPDRPDYEIGIDGEHVRTVNRMQAVALYAALRAALAAPTVTEVRR